MKKIRYYIPTIILLIYDIIYIPLLNYLVDNQNKDVVSPHNEAVKIMNIISIVIIIITILYNVFFGRKTKGINENEKIINTILIIGLIMGIVFFTVLNMVV